MSAQGNSLSSSNDVIDLISDEDDEENESQRSQKTLDGFYELASLRSLFPPNFLVNTSESDYNFFSEELALSLFTISKTKTQSTENRTCVNTDLSKSARSSGSATPTTSVSENSLNNGSNFEQSKKCLLIKPVLVSMPVQKHPTSGMGTNHSNTNRVSLTSLTKLGNGLYKELQSNPPIENSTGAANNKEKIALNGAVANCSSFHSKGITSIKEKMTLNGALASTSLASSQSNNLLSKLTATKALETLKTQDTTAPKSITFNGFTITPTVKNVNNTATPSTEARRRLPPASYNCEKCHEKFRYNVALLDHLSNVHRISVDTVSNDSNSSSQNVKTKKSNKRKRSKKDNAVLKSAVSDSKKAKSKGMKKKRRKKGEDKDIASTSKKVSSSGVSEISSEMSSMESVEQKSGEESPERVPEPQFIDTTYIVPKIEKGEVESSPALMCETSMDDSSDNLIMDIAEEKESNNIDSESEIDFFSDASRSKITDVNEYMKCFKFLTYYEIEYNENIRYKCSTCNKLCAAIELVLDHSEKCNGRKSLKCLFPNCPQVKFVPTQFKDHLKNKHDIITHTCKVCKSFFVQADDLKVHQLSCVNSENSQYQCPVKGCKVTYFYEMHFRAHLSRRHKIITIFTCKVCKLIFYEEEDLNSHLQTAPHIAANAERLRRLSELAKKLGKKPAQKEEKKSV